ncbi:hypothetical protein FRC17_010188 [Serendipita sp. 399]|nr:hypothetical protein FRC17_010188 [Serendipita sp. 399]
MTTKDISTMFHLLSNNPPTAVETERIRQLLISRRRDKNYLSIAAKIEDSRIGTCQKAISNLEMAIPRGKATLQMHEANLTALLDIQLRFTNFRNLPDLEIEDDAYSSKLYRDMKAAGHAPILRSSRFINQQVDILTGEIRTLLDHIKNLDLELQGWKSSLQLSQTSLQTLTASITQTEATIDAAAAAFRPFLRFPAEIWQTIFQIVVHDEMEDYVKSNNQNPLRSAALVLAHTCRLWRDLVYRDVTLWRVITIHASQYWPRPLYKCFAHCTAQAASPAIFMINLSQCLEWKYSDHWNRRHEKQLVELQSLDWQVALGGKSYVLHIVMSNDQSDFTRRIAFIPYHDPASLTISSRSSILHSNTFSDLRHFNGVRSLTIVNDYPKFIFSATTNLATILPQLTALTYKVKRFPAGFELFSFLPSALEELYVYHNTGDFPIGSSSPFEYSKLRSLGLTGLGANVLQLMTAPSLRTLVLYGPDTLSSPTTAIGSVADNIYGRITRLEFEGWKEARAGAISSFKEVAIKSRSLRYVKFTRCWINGEELIASLGIMRDSAVHTFSKLERIALSHTTGITRDQCSRLQSIVKTLDIYK